MPSVWTVLRSCSLCKLFVNLHFFIHLLIMIIGSWLLHHTFVISDWIRTLLTKWSGMELDRARQRHVRHNVLLLAFSCGPAFSHFHCSCSLVVSISSFTCTHFTTSVITEFEQTWLENRTSGIQQNRYN